MHRDQGEFVADIGFVIADDPPHVIGVGGNRGFLPGTGRRLGVSPAGSPGVNRVVPVVPDQHGVNHLARGEACPDRDGFRADLDQFRELALAAVGFRVKAKDERIVKPELAAPDCRTPGGVGRQFDPVGVNQNVPTVRRTPVAGVGGHFLGVDASVQNRVVFLELKRERAADDIAFFAVPVAEFDGEGVAVRDALERVRAGADRPADRHFPGRRRRRRLGASHRRIKRLADPADKDGRGNDDGVFRRPLRVFRRRFRRGFDAAAEQRRGQQGVA